MQSVETLNYTALPQGCKPRSVWRPGLLIPLISTFRND